MAPCPKPKARPTARPTARAIRQTGSIRALLPEQMRPPTARRADRNDKAKRAPTVGPFFFVTEMVTPGRLELPAYGLGNRRSILLSYGVAGQFQHFQPDVPTFCPVLFLRARRFSWTDSTNRESGWT